MPEISNAFQSMAPEHSGPIPPQAPSGGAQPDPYALACEFLNAQLAAKKRLPPELEDLLLPIKRHRIDPQVRLLAAPHACRCPSACRSLIALHIFCYVCPESRISSYTSGVIRFVYLRNIRSQLPTSFQAWLTGRTCVEPS